MSTTEQVPQEPRTDQDRVPQHIRVALDDQRPAGGRLALVTMVVLVAIAALIAAAWTAGLIP